MREQLERDEYERLSPYACKSADSRGRKKPADKCDMRTEFQKDRDRITHCKAFRRLMHKTQVFISPEGDHYRTRLTHTLEVAQIARVVARALRLNEDLTEAIALGHDLGHTPFGHTGEEALDALSPGGFKHNEQSVRVVEYLENNGEGLNLTFEVVDGILNHRTAGRAATLEGDIVRLSDKIAYINHDIDDALRAGVLQREALPQRALSVLGQESRTRINFLAHNVVAYSRDKDTIALEPAVWQTMMELRAFLFAHVYENQLRQAERKKIQSMIGLLFQYYMDHTDELPPEMHNRLTVREPVGCTQVAGAQGNRDQVESEKGNYAQVTSEQGNRDQVARVVCDYIAGMTDRFALKRYTALFMPAAWDS